MVEKRQLSGTDASDAGPPTARARAQSPSPEERLHLENHEGRQPAEFVQSPPSSIDPDTGVREAEDLGIIAQHEHCHLTTTFPIVDGFPQTIKNFGYRVLTVVTYTVRDTVNPESDMVTYCSQLIFNAVDSRGQPHTVFSSAVSNKSEQDALETLQEKIEPEKLDHLGFFYQRLIREELGGAYAGPIEDGESGHHGANFSKYLDILLWSKKSNMDKPFL